MNFCVFGEAASGLAQAVRAKSFWMGDVVLRLSELLHNEQTDVVTTAFLQHLRNRDATYWKLCPDMVVRPVTLCDYLSLARMMRYDYVGCSD